METGKGYVFKMKLLLVLSIVCDWPCFSTAIGLMVGYAVLEAGSISILEAEI